MYGIPPTVKFLIFTFFKCQLYVVMLVYIATIHVLFLVRCICRIKGAV